MREQSASNTRGRLVGRYVVHDRIAAGGMATVHIGRLLGAAGFSRTVAIKRLHDAYAKDPEFVAMLLDEARIAAMIRHPNVVPTLDVVAEQDELLVVMEYVEGDSVGHLVKVTSEAKGRVPIAFAASIIVQALHGLHAAHEARDKNGEPLDIVHRDVSPQNILVGTDGVARVLDFGIAKAASRATATEDGQIKGKTAYMSPEQLQHGSVDRRTDIFAASVVLWELLCGRRLFFADSPSETMARVLTLPIDRPELHTPNLPPALSNIAMRGLARDPAERFATAEEMALAIEDAIALPRAKDVGAWVATTAHATLEARTQLVQVVESSSHKMPAASSTSDSTLARAIDEADRRRQHADMPTDVGHVSNPPPAPLPPSPPSHGGSSSGRVGTSYGPALVPVRAPALPGEESTDIATVQSTSHPVKVRPQSSRAALALAIAGGSALVLALLVVVLMRRGTIGGRAETPAIDAAPPAAMTVEPVLSATVAASAAPSAVPSSVPSVAHSTAATKPTTRPTGGRPPPPPPRNKCEIPFVIDAKGQKHFKPECVAEP